jgi:hypothetical protein
MTMGIEGEVAYPSVSQLETFFIASGRLSLATRSVTTSGWRGEFIEFVEFVGFIETGDTLEIR